MGFGTELAALRRRKGLGQDDLARTLRVSRSYISHLERGAKVPRDGVINQIAAILALAPEERSRLLEQAGFSRRHVSLGRSISASEVDLVNRLVRGMHHLRPDQLKVLRIIVEDLPPS